MFMEARLFNIRKNISSNLVQDVIFSFVKTYINSSVNLTESEISVVSVSNIFSFTFNDTSS